MVTRAESGRLQPVQGLSGPLWLVLSVAATFPVFWFGFEMLAQEWARPEFRFKPVVPLVSFLLFLQVLRTMPPAGAREPGRWLGIVGVVGAMGVAVLGNLLQIDDFVFFAIIGWIASLILVCFGLRKGLAFWAPVGSLLLMLPLPRFVVAPIHRFLETLASDIAIALLWLRGIPAMLDGQILDFGIYQLRAQEATAGVVNFLPVLLVFFFFATFYRGPFWTRVLPLLLAAPVMVLLAAVKVVLLGVAVDRGGAEAAETVLRLANDWVFFLVSVTVLLGVTVAAHRVTSGRLPGRAGLDLGLGDVGAQATRLASLRITRPMLAATITTAAISVLFASGLSRPTVAIEREGFARFPQHVGGWAGTRTALMPDVEMVLGADDYVNIDFHAQSERAPVNFWSAYYYVQEGDEGGIHSPQDCLPLDDWNIVSFRPVEVALERRGTLVLNRAVIRKGDVEAIVYYWFDGRGRRLANERMARIMVKVDGLFRGRTDGALVRYFTTIHPDESEAEAEARLQRLMGDTLDHIHRFIPA